MSEIPQPDDHKPESVGEYDGSLAATYAHFFGDVLIVSLFHKGHGVMQKQDGSVGSKEELSPDEVRADSERIKQAFLERMRGIDFDKKHAFGSVDKSFIESVITLASGDWCDPQVIQKLMDQFKSVSHPWQR